MEDATYHSRSNDGKETSFTGSDSHLEHDFEESLDGLDQSPVKYIRLRTLAMGLIVSLGGLIFGYDIGQISGFVQMPDFIARFAGPSGSFSNWKEGLIVGLLSIGTLFGVVIAGASADLLGRRYAIVALNMVFIIGVIVQIVTTDKWYQIGIGRCVAGVGVGGLSILTPMYQSETAPRQIRGGLVSAYQLFITFGIFLAECINYGTEARPDASSWRITMGIGFIFPVAMAIGILFLRESPRWDYRRGKIREARETLALSYGVSESHYEVVREMREIREKFDEEKRSEHPWFEILTGPRMAYRTIIGMVLQSLQQLTGINFFLYFGTTIFKGVGLSNPFITQMILGGINFGCTFLGLYLVDHYGRRRCLVAGGLWMFVCFMIFASVGHFQFYPNYNAMPKPGTTAEKDVNTAGNVMIVFTALFMFGFATSWGPIVWALVSEIYPSRYRARSMGIATSANWTWNFLISFFTPYCISAIEFRYGYVFAACCFAGAVFVYFCVPESQGRTLEEIDTMYIMHVTPWKSSGWNPPRVRKANVEDNVGRI